MQTLARPFVIGLAVLATGCTCRPALPQPPDDPPEDTSEDDTADTAPVDTAPAPPCDVPEVEPNDAVADATALPVEALGCGDWEAPGDVDYFAFDLEEEAWLKVEVDAKSLGSVADAHLLVTAADGSAMSRVDDDGSTDATLVFPAVPQHYDVQLLEQNGQGDTTRYFYEVRASVAKPPVSPTRYEVEPNDGSVDAELAYDGDVIFGDMSGPADSDWFQISVPAGKHTLTLETVAFAEGSPGDFSLMIYDSGIQPLPLGCNDCAVTGPPNSFAHDPLLEWESTGDELLYFRIFEQEGRNGDAVWYALHVTLEGP